MNADKENLNTNRFAHIWNREENSNDNITEVANKLAENIGNVSSDRLNPKTWGFNNWVINLLIFFAVQVIISVIFLYGTTTNTSTPESILNAATNPMFILFNALSMYVVWIGGMAWVTYRHGERSFKKDFKLFFKKWDIFIGLGIAAFLYLFVAGLQILLTDVFHVDLEGSNNGAFLLANDGIWLVIIAFGIASLLGPISEELWFRGFLMQSIFKSVQNQKNKVEKLQLTKENAPVRWRFVLILDKIKYPLALITTSVIFGLFHFQGTFATFGSIFVIIITGTLGLVLGLSALVFKRLGPSIFAHIFYNFSTLAIALIFSTS